MMHRTIPLSVSLVAVNLTSPPEDCSPCEDGGGQLFSMLKATIALSTGLVKGLDNSLNAIPGDKKNQILSGIDWLSTMISPKLDNK
jgi:hypothetical protein